jgi:hypothetical protein
MLAEFIGELIYPLEIIQNLLSLLGGQGLDSVSEAVQQLRGGRIPIETFRESDIPLFKVIFQV